MSFEIDNTSLVIIADAHTPSAITLDFLKKHGMMKDGDEVKPETFISLPPLTQIVFKDESGIVVEANRLLLRGVSSVPERPFERGEKYSKQFSNILCSAIGINIAFTCSNSLLDRLNVVEPLNDATYQPDELIISFPHPSGKTQLKFVRQVDKSVMAEFNFDFQYKNIPLGEIEIDFLKSWKANKTIAINTLKRFINDV